MNQSMTLIVISAFILSTSACVTKHRASNTCSFINVLDKYDLSSPATQARKFFSEGKIYFVRIGDGIGPSTPGLDELTQDEFQYFEICVFQNTEFSKSEIIMVGADHEFCDQRKDVRKKAYDYAKKFNIEMYEKILSIEHDECAPYKLH